MTRAESFKCLKTDLADMIQDAAALAIDAPPFDVARLIAEAVEHLSKALKFLEFARTSEETQTVKQKEVVP